MSGVFCPNCGKQHESKERFCEFCGEDLSDVIIQYKNKKLPVKLEYNEPKLKEDVEVKEKKYPTGSPLPPPGRVSRKEHSLFEDGEEANICEFIFKWCI